MSGGLDATRKQWARQKPQWLEQIDHAAKRKALRLSIHMPYGTVADGYLDHLLAGQEHDSYVAACDLIRDWRDGLYPHEKPDKIDTATDTVFNTRKAIVDRLPWPREACTI